MTGLVVWLGASRAMRLLLLLLEEEGVLEGKGFVFGTAEVEDNEKDEKLAGCGIEKCELEGLRMEKATRLLVSRKKKEQA